MIRATFAGFDTALSAMRANQKKLDVVGHNLANMNTEGYTRQELKTSSVNYEFVLPLTIFRSLLPICRTPPRYRTLYTRES